MEVLTITCPKCTRGLKVKDRNLLGRKGRCPACGGWGTLVEERGSSPGAAWDEEAGGGRHPPSRQPNGQTSVTSVIPPSQDICAVSPSQRAVLMSHATQLFSPLPPAELPPECGGTAGANEGGEDDD